MEVKRIHSDNPIMATHQSVNLPPGILFTILNRPILILALGRQYQHVCQSFNSINDDLIKLYRCCVGYATAQALFVSYYRLWDLVINSIAA